MSATGQAVVRAQEIGMALPREVVRVGCIALTAVVGLQVLTASAVDPATRLAQLRAREIKAVLLPWTATSAHTAAAPDRGRALGEFEPQRPTDSEHAERLRQMRAELSPKAS